MDLQAFTYQLAHKQLLFFAFHQKLASSITQNLAQLQSQLGNYVGITKNWRTYELAENLPSWDLQKFKIADFIENSIFCLKFQAIAYDKKKCLIISVLHVILDAMRHILMT